MPRGSNLNLTNKLNFAILPNTVIYLIFSFNVVFVYIGFIVVLIAKSLKMEPSSEGELGL